MTNELEISIEELYKIFSKYPFKSTMEGCPCCVSDADKSTLHSKPLRELEDKDISRYAFKAMTTWGDVNDFKHYLPRIFELSSTQELMVFDCVVLGKLEYGNWGNWDKEEIDTIIRFLKAWWINDINNNAYFDAELFIKLSKLVNDLPEMLNNWSLDVKTPGFKNYVYLIEQNYQDLKNRNKKFTTLNAAELDLFIAWIESNAYRLEEGFFKYESEDQEFSKRISNTLYMLEIIK